MTPLHMPETTDSGDQPLSNHVFAFTGKLSSLSRNDAHALVQRLGGATADDVTAKTTVLVVGAEGFQKGGHAKTTEDETEQSRKLRKAEQINSQRTGQIAIISEEDFCRLAGLTSPVHLKQRFYGLRDICDMYANIREDHVSYLEKLGLVSPVMRTNAEKYYSFGDLLVIKQVSAEFEHGVPLRAVVRSLVAARRGQLALDFRPVRSDAHPAKVVTFEQTDVSPGRPAAPAGPVQQPVSDMARVHFLEGAHLDEGDESDRDLAMEAYRRALAYDPDCVPAIVNFANIHYARNQLIEAQALYERAMGLEPDCFEAIYNLGNVHHDAGRYEAAVTCYRDALALNPQYADAHFYLAVTLQKMGRSQQARPHWIAYRQLAPDGDWVELARELSE